MKIFYFSIGAPSGNFGDDVIQYATRLHMERLFGDVEWVTYPMRYHTTAEMFRTLNSCDMALVGPGGIILPMNDSFSGYQWNISERHLKKIQIPLVVLAAGWNLFRGQILTPFAHNHLRLLGERADIFTVREWGSQRKLRDLGVKGVEVCPCPSMFVDTEKRKIDADVPMIGINLAGDRRGFRFGNLFRFHEELNDALSEISADGCSLWQVNHSWSPEMNMSDITAHRVDMNVRNIETNWLTDKTLPERIRSFKDFDVMIGMRGHGCMVPFGQGVPVIGLSSHKKIDWFMESVGHDDLIIDANDPSQIREIPALVKDMVEHQPTHAGSVVASMAIMRGLFNETMDKIAALVPRKNKWKEMTFPCRDGG